MVEPKSPIRWEASPPPNILDRLELLDPTAAPTESSDVGDRLGRRHTRDVEVMLGRRAMEAAI